MVRPSPPGPGTVTERARFPVFGVSWSDSALVYCGGGGSAKTGVGNCIVVSGEERVTNIDTDDQICVAVDVYPKNSSSAGPCYVAAAIDQQVRIYHGQSGHCMGSYKAEGASWEGFNTVRFNNDGHLLLAGCENGTIVSFSLHWENVAPIAKPDAPLPKVNFTKLAIFVAGEHKTAPAPAGARQPPEVILDHRVGHSRAICGLAYNPFRQQANLKQCLTCAKDGTLKVWNYETGKLIASAPCFNFEMEAKAPKRMPQILVRGCGYGSNGLMYTVQSGRRLHAFVSQWRLVVQPPTKKEEGPRVSLIEMSRLCISNVPISAMTMSSDGDNICCGSVDGAVIKINADSMQVTKLYEGIHDLPITGIAARPLGDYGVVEVITASADSKLVRLSMARQPMSWIAFWVNLLFFVTLAIIGWFSAFENQCYTELIDLDFEDYQSCLVHSIVAPMDTPGVGSIPY